MKEAQNSRDTEQVLRIRLNKAVQYQRPFRRQLRSVEPTYLPQPRVNLDIVTTSEMYVLLIEGIQAYKTEPQRAAADKFLANALRTADYITDTLPGNDEAVKFVTEVCEFTKNTNPNLAKEIEKVMEAAYKRCGIREKRREDLYKRWRANQKPDLRQQ